MNKKYVQYGCGLSAPNEWENFDVSPTLRFQKIPILGKLFAAQLHTIFPENVKYGDILKGLPLAENSCDGVYCSHTLEHFSLEEFYVAIQNTYKILKPGGIFRCVLPDLEWAARTYLNDLGKGNDLAQFDFMGFNTLLGKKKRPRGLVAMVSSYLSNSNHLWMWDVKSLSHELAKAGFKNARRAQFGDSIDPMFIHCENPDRFTNHLAIECIK
jgi:SAM-dependent methyltransferase